MPRALSLATAFLVLPLGYASADAPPERGANAALKYWQAFATLPRFTDAEQKKLNEYLTGSLDDHARELVTKAEYSLQMMQHGAALQRCDWGIGYEEGIYTRLPQANAARVLCNLACLRARLRFEKGQDAKAIEDILAALTLGRHISQDGTLMLVLVGYAIERRVIDTLALDLPRLNAGTIKGLKTRLSALPSFGSLATAMRHEEKAFLDWFIRTVKEAKDKERLLALLSDLLDRGEEGRPSPGRGRAFFKECGGTAEGVLKFAEETRSCFARVAKNLDLPLDQFEKEFAREQTKQAGNPVFKLIFPAIPNCRRARARIEVRRALLSAALAVQLDGRDALKDHPDLVVGGPFEYVAFNGGFELRSKLKGRDGKPVALTVGRRGK